MQAHCRTASDIKSLLGVTQYVSCFIPNYATITAPLRLLTRQNMPWKWEQEQQKALEETKDDLVGDQVMSYFDARKQTEIIADASPVGLSGLLTQEGKVLSYASCALNDVESRYSQTEREMLAVVWAAEHFHLYVYGAQFSISLITSNLQQGLPYDCKLIYRPGKDAETPADSLSRHPCPSDLELQNLTEDYVNYVCTTAVPKAMTLEDIKQTTKVDAEMQALIKAIETYRWTSPEVQD